MAEFIVDVALIAAVLVLLVIWLVTATRRRRTDRREHAAERRLILAAFTGAAASPAEMAPAGGEPGEPAAPRPARRAARTNPAAPPVPALPLDAASVAALLDLLEDRRPARRGMIAGLVTSPRSVWSAGTRAGQTVGQRSMAESQHPSTGRGETNSELYRAAASELVDIHAHDPGDAHAEYIRYAAAVGDAALAELYVCSAAYATYAEHDQVRQVLEDIIVGGQPPEMSDDDASIDA